MSRVHAWFFLRRGDDFGRVAPLQGDPSAIPMALTLAIAYTPGRMFASQRERPRATAANSKSRCAWPLLMREASRRHSTRHLAAVLIAAASVAGCAPRRGMTPSPTPGGDAAEPPALLCSDAWQALQATAAPVSDGAPDAAVHVELFYDVTETNSQVVLATVADEVAHYRRSAVRLSVRQLPKQRSGPLAEPALAALVNECTAPGSYLEHGYAAPLGPDPLSKQQTVFAPGNNTTSRSLESCNAPAKLMSDMDAALALGAYSAPALFVEGFRVLAPAPDIVAEIMAEALRRRLAPHDDGPRTALCPDFSQLLPSNEVSRSAGGKSLDSSALISITEDDWVLGSPAAPVKLVGFFCLEGARCERHWLRARRLQSVFGRNQIQLVFKHRPERPSARAKHEHLANLSASDAWTALQTSYFNTAINTDDATVPNPDDFSPIGGAPGLKVDDDLALGRRLHLGSAGALFANGQQLPDGPFADAVEVLAQQWRRARAARRRTPAAVSPYAALADDNVAKRRAGVLPAAAAPQAAYPAMGIELKAEDASAAAAAGEESRSTMNSIAVAQQLGAALRRLRARPQ